MFKTQLKSDSGDLTTEMQLFIDAYSEFHHVLSFLLHAQELTVNDPNGITESVSEGQYYCNQTLRLRSEALKQRMGELFSMMKAG